MNHDNQPLSAETYFRQGNEKANLEDHEGAINDYDQAIRLKPEYAEASENQKIAIRCSLLSPTITQYTV